jgi:hypothetical protein
MKYAIFTTVVNTNEIVNAVGRIEALVQDSQITFKVENGYLRIEGPGVSTQLKIKKLNRPSSEEIRASADNDTLLVIRSISEKAAQVASGFNHIIIPTGGFRIVGLGLALLNSGLKHREEKRSVKLRGRSGVIAESLLLGGIRQWSVAELAEASQVSPALAHRVLSRLEEEGLVEVHGSGNEKRRSVKKMQALAELWSDEEESPQTIFRGYIYKADINVLAAWATTNMQNSCVGGILAANQYKPILTRVNPPVRIWVPTSFTIHRDVPFELDQAVEGANIEICQSKDDGWMIHMDRNRNLLSKWRAWVEVSHEQGRTKELADAILTELI